MSVGDNFVRVRLCPTGFVLVRLCRACGRYRRVHGNVYTRDSAPEPASGRLRPGGRIQVLRGKLKFAVDVRLGSERNGQRDWPPARKQGQDDRPKFSRYLTTSRSEMTDCLRRIALVDHLMRQKCKTTRPRSFVRIAKVGRIGQWCSRFVRERVTDDGRKKRCHRYYVAFIGAPNLPQRNNVSYILRTRPLRDDSEPSARTYISS